MYHGDIRLGATIDIKFTTRAFATGAPTTLAGTPVISAYVDNDTTQLTAGITLTVDFDGVTGLHNVRVVASGGNGYATATNVALVITTGTVGGVSVVGEVVGTFSIENRSALMPTTAGRTLDVTATGAAGVDWANVEGQSTAVNLSATNIDVDQVVASVSGAVGSVTARVTANVDQLNGVAQSLLDLKDFADDGYDPATNKVQGVVLVDTLTTYTGNTPQTGDSFARLGAPAGASVSADIAAVKSDTAAILTDTTAIDARLPADPADESNVLAAIAGVLADTDNIQTRLPAALVGGRMASNAEVVGDKTGYALSTAGNNAAADALLDRADGVEIGLTPRQEMRLTAAASAGKTSGAPGSPFVIRNAVADSKARITATVDGVGNRTAVATDVT